jgi:hypothetical protein
VILLHKKVYCDIRNGLLRNVVPRKDEIRKSRYRERRRKSEYGNPLNTESHVRNTNLYKK